MEATKTQCEILRDLGYSVRRRGYGDWTPFDPFGNPINDGRGDDCFKTRSWAWYTAKEYARRYDVRFSLRVEVA